VPGLGFTIRYAPQPDGVWFPVNFSTEFKIHVLYFFHRQIILDAQNRDFEQTHVTSRIVGDATPVEPSQIPPQRIMYIYVHQSCTYSTLGLWKSQSPSFAAISSPSSRMRSKEKRSW
jgi:hypothetical protein